MAILRQRTSFGPGIYRGHRLDVDRLRSFVDGTNRAIAANVPIPLLKLHAPINSNDRQTEEFAKQEGAGWLTKVELEPDGNIAWEAKDVPEQVVKDVTAGTVRFTSPEFRQHYECEKAGVYTGPVIRHFAFTPKPGNPHQGPVEVVALAETDSAWQFSEEERQPLSLAEDKSPPEPLLKPAVAINNPTATFTAPPDHTPSDKANGKDKSIDWDSLTEYECSKVVDDLAKNVTTEDISLGKQAQFESEHGSLHEKSEASGLTGNPTSWVGDEATWEKAKKAVGSKYKGDSKWPVITSVYKKMGGKVKSTQYAEGDDPHVAGRFVGTKQEIGPFEHHVKKHGGIVDQHGNFSVPKSRVKAMHKSLSGGDFQHGRDYHLLGHGPDSQHAEIPPDKIDKKKGIDNKEVDSENPTSTPSLNEGESPPEKPNAENPADNPDMPPAKATDKSKLAAILSGLAQKNIVLPSDYDFAKEGAMDILLGCLNSAIAAENKVEADTSDDEDDDDDEVKTAPMPFSEKSKPPKAGDYVMQFTEEELKLLPPALKEKLDAEIKAHEDKAKEATAKAEQFEEEKRVATNNAARESAIGVIKSTKIPPVLKQELLTAYLPTMEGDKEINPATIQFSEGKEQPIFTATDVAKMVASTLPPSLQFLESTVTMSDNPDMKGVIGYSKDGQPIVASSDGEQFFEDGGTPAGHVSVERARELVDANPVIGNKHYNTNQPIKTVSETVAAENQRVPNKVMNQ